MDVHWVRDSELVVETQYHSCVSANVFVEKNCVFNQMQNTWTASLYQTVLEICASIPLEGERHLAAKMT